MKIGVKFNHFVTKPKNVAFNFSKIVNYYDDSKDKLSSLIIDLLKPYLCFIILWNVFAIDKISNK
ncbi:hypothetical protein BLOT_013071 [Blomia tropicalis]|nr:hypothetical protein BLOT_013071 [Blomia tropicalis]